MTCKKKLEMSEIKCEQKIIKIADSDVEMKVCDLTDTSESGKENSESRNGNSEQNSKTVRGYFYDFFSLFLCRNM